MGILLIGEGNTLKKGKYKSQLNKIHKYLLRISKEEKLKKSQHGSWVFSFALLYFSNYYLHDKNSKLKTTINSLIEIVESGNRQNLGWNHSLTNKNETYKPFVAVTTWATAALLYAEKAGFEINREKLNPVIDNLENSIGKNGGGFYYTKNKKTHVSPGRSGAIAWILYLDKRTTSESHRKALNFIIKNLDVSIDGHSSLTLNLVWTSLGISTGTNAQKSSFKNVILPRMLKARNKNKTFTPIKWNEIAFKNGKDKKINLGSKNTWPDGMYGEGWSTIWFLFAWQCMQGKSILYFEP